MTNPLTKWWSQNCEVHARHWPFIHGTEIHHILPLSWGGVRSPENEVESCPTGHTNMHVLLDLFRDLAGDVPKERTKGFSRGEIRLVKRGYEEWSAAQ